MMRFSRAAMLPASRIACSNAIGDCSASYLLLANTLPCHYAELTIHDLEVNEGPTSGVDVQMCKEARHLPRAMVVLHKC